MEPTKAASPVNSIPHSDFPIPHSLLSIYLEALTVAAVLLGWCGLFTATPPEGATIASLLLALVTVGAWRLMLAGLGLARAKRLERGDWWGLDATLRRITTSLALGGCLALVVWATMRASVGAKLGGGGALLVLLVVVSIGVKLVAETYLFAHLGDEPTPRRTSAEQLNGPLAGWSKLRYALGAFGGIILPLGAQILAGGAKNIPAVVDAGPPAVMAGLALACLLPGELLERWLFWRAVGSNESSEHPSAA